MNIKKYICAVMMTVAGLALSSCDKALEPGYDPAVKPATTQRVYFAKSSESFIVTADATSVSVPIYRPEEDSKDALTVQLLTTDTSGLFKVPAAVEFPAGQSMTEIAVGYNTADMEPNKAYPISIAVDEANANVYGIATVNVSLNFEQMTEWALFGYDPEQGRNGYGVWTLGSPFSGFFANMRVFERHIPTNPDNIQYSVQLNIPGNIEGSVPEDDIDTSNTDFNDPNWIEAISMTSDDGGKHIYISRQDCVFNPTVFFGEAGQIYPSQFRNTSYFDPVSGIFYLNLMYGDSEGLWNPAINPIAMYGYADTNEYNLNLSFAGQVNIADTDYAIVGVTFNENVDYVDYTVVKGELDEEQLAAVIEKMQDPDQTEYTITKLEKAGNISLDFPSSGKYTVVALGYHTNNKGELEMKTSDSLTFDYTTFNPYDGWEVVRESTSYTDHILADLFGDASLVTTYNVGIDKSTRHEGLWRISNPYANNPFVSEVGSLGKFGAIEIVIPQDNPNMAYIQPSVTGLNMAALGGAEMEICSYAYYMLANEVAPSDIPAVLWGVLNGNVVTFSPIGDGENGNLVVNNKYLCDAEISVDLSGNTPSAPAKAKAKKAHDVKRISADRFNGKTPVFPAQYIGKFQPVQKKVTLRSDIKRRPRPF